VRRNLLTEKAFLAFLKEYAAITGEDGTRYHCESEDRIVHYEQDCSSCLRQPRCQRYLAADDYCCAALEGRAVEKAKWYGLRIVAPFRLDRYIVRNYRARGKISGESNETNQSCSGIYSLW